MSQLFVICVVVIVSLLFTKHITLLVESPSYLLIIVINDIKVFNPVYTIMKIWFLQIINSSFLLKGIEQTHYLIKKLNQNYLNLNFYQMETIHSPRSISFKIVRNSQSSDYAGVLLHASSHSI